MVCNGVLVARLERVAANQCAESGMIRTMNHVVLRMTTAHLVRWSTLSGIVVALWTWIVLSDGQVIWRVVGIGLGFLALRTLLGSLVAFRRRPSLTIGTEALTVTDVLRSRTVPWSKFSEFRTTASVIDSRVRYTEAGRRKILPAGFADSTHQLSANELAEVLNAAKAASTLN